MDKLSNMKAFTVVAETRSFAEAARRLGIAHSVVSKRVKDLEDFLGVQLLQRTTRHVSLTETGFSYLERARKLVEEIEEIEDLVRNKNQNPTGEIRLSAPVSFGIGYLGPAMSGYLGKYPDVTIHASLSDRRVDLTEEGFDLAIRIGELKDSGLISKKLSSTRLVAVAAPGYFKKHGKPKTPKDLSTHNCLSYSNLAEGKAWPFSIAGEKTWVSVSGRFQSDNGDMLREAALSGCGIAMLPTFIVGKHIEDGQLETALEGFKESDFNIYAVYQHRRHLSAKVRTFIDYLGDYFSADRD